VPPGGLPADRNDHIPREASTSSGAAETATLRCPFNPYLRCPIKPYLRCPIETYLRCPIKRYKAYERVLHIASSVVLSAARHSSLEKQHLAKTRLDALVEDRLALADSLLGAPAPSLVFPVLF